MPYNPTVCEHIENWILWFIKKNSMYIYKQNSENFS